MTTAVLPAALLPAGAPHWKLEAALARASRLGSSSSSSSMVVVVTSTDSTFT